MQVVGWFQYKSYSAEDFENEEWKNAAPRLKIEGIDELQYCWPTELEFSGSVYDLEDIDDDLQMDDNFRGQHLAEYRRREED